MENEFKFTVGQTVILKSDYEFAVREEQANFSYKDKHIASGLFITQRLYVECSGGIQRYYDCEHWGQPIQRFHENNLVSLNEYLDILFKNTHSIQTK